ncbi:hypothetical protein D3C76_1176990 [compost metagenome]
MLRNVQHLAVGFQFVQRRAGKRHELLRFKTKRSQRLTLIFKLIGLVWIVHHHHFAKRLPLHGGTERSVAQTAIVAQQITIRNEVFQR